VSQRYGAGAEALDPRLGIRFTTWVPGRPLESLAHTLQSDLTIRSSRDHFAAAELYGKLSQRRGRKALRLNSGVRAHMKISRTLSVGLIALTVCASAGKPPPVQNTSPEETSAVSATVVKANNYAHPECKAATASCSKVIEPGAHSSMEEWSVTCGPTTRTYKVLIARLGGGITADALENEPIMLQPTPSECAELRRMLKQAEASSQTPTSDLIAAHQQVLYKTLACQ